MGYLPMCHRKPIELIAHREADVEDESEEESAAETPTFVAPSD